MRHKCLFAGCLFILSARPMLLIPYSCLAKRHVPSRGAGRLHFLDVCSGYLFSLLPHSFRDHKSLSTEYKTMSNCKFVPDAEIRSGEEW